MSSRRCLREPGILFSRLIRQRKPIATPFGVPEPPYGMHFHLPRHHHHLQFSSRTNDNPIGTQWHWHWHRTESLGHRQLVYRYRYQTFERLFLFRAMDPPTHCSSSSHRVPCPSHHCPALPHLSLALSSALFLISAGPVRRNICDFLMIRKHNKRKKLDF